MEREFEFDTASVPGIDTQCAVDRFMDAPFFEARYVTVTEGFGTLYSPFQHY
jgi:hypothetical protein